MPNLQIPGSLCRILNPDYTGPESPKVVTDTIVDAARKMITGVVKAGISPALLPHTHDSGISRNVSFPAAIMDVIEDHAFNSNLSTCDAIRAFLYAAIARGDALSYQTTIDDSLAVYRDALNWTRRPEQSLLFNHVVEVLSKNEIGFIEGSTGIGKTLAMVAAAAKTIEKGGRAVICTPTIQILRDFIKTHDEIEQNAPDLLPEKRVVLGRSEYISRGLLESVLMEGAVAVDATPIMEWLNQGAPSIKEDAPLGDRVRYLASSLLIVSPDFPVDGVRLTERTTPDDPGMLAYRAQFSRDDDNDRFSGNEIIYCTHAMVAIDVRRAMTAAKKEEDVSDAHSKIASQIKVLSEKLKPLVTPGEKKKSSAAKEVGQQIAALIKEAEIHTVQAARTNDFGHLPPWQYLIVDEAHLFEQSLASVLSSNIAISEMRRNVQQAVEGGWLPLRAFKTVTHSFLAMKSLADNGDIDLNRINSDNVPERDAVNTARIALAEAADAICSSRKKADEPEWVASLRLAAGEIKQALRIANKSAGSNSCTLRFSPVRDFPLLAYGRRSLERELSFLWSRASACACVSATLYLRKLDKDSASYMANLLHVPKNRAREYPPIRPAWTLKPVKAVWTPESILVNNRYWLQPPSRSDRRTDGEPLSKEESESISKQWINQVSDTIARLHNGTAGQEKTAGGMLVLMTSYDSVHRVAKNLASRTDALVQANTQTTLAQQRALFVNFALAGRRPVWLALGGAWTGLDINGKNYGISAEEDNLITDLVIPRIPFGVNSSLTQQYRMNTLSAIPWDLLDAVMRLKQGLGRAIRREGLPQNRRFFVLDGRLNDPRSAKYLLPIRQVIGAYPQQRLSHE